MKITNSTNNIKSFAGPNFISAEFDPATPCPDHKIYRRTPGFPTG